MAALTPLQTPARLRILLLHSFRTSAAIFKEQIRRSGLQRPLNEVGDLAPIHGICGFSQGAALASLLAGWQQQGNLPEIEPLRFFLMIGGTPTRGHAECYKDPLRIPSLHFIGEKDFLKKYSQALADLFVEPVVIRHKGGHSVPALAAEQAGELRTFLLHQANRTAQGQASL